MANFVQGDASPIANIQAWTPDWSFLENVYGVTQQRYDRGFNMVKSLYNSVLNSNVTNSQNAEFRNTIFQKLQSSLRNVAGLDLSNPTNVQTAKSLMDPITNDKELAYDMYATRHHDSQKQIMDSFKNSTDIKKRELYSDYAKQYIQHSEDQLRSAKRGDGSITSVQPRDFVAFDDTNAYLNEQAEKAKLKIVTSSSQGGYILTDTNGKPAEKPFAEWAAMQLGTKFDRQFQVMGSVKAENEIRSVMQEKQISRKEAEAEVATKLSQQYLDSQTKTKDAIDNNLVDINRAISQYDRKFPAGIPSGNPNLQEDYGKLKEAKKLLEDNQKLTESEIKKLTSGDNSYILNNLSGIYSNQAKKTAAILWGTTRAETTAEHDMKPDQKVISDWDRAAQNARSAADRELSWRKHQDEQQWKQKDYDLKVQQHDQKMELDIMKAKNKGELPSEQRVGTMVGTKTTGVQVLAKANAVNRDEMFNNTFGANKGLMNLVINDKGDHGKYYTVIKKLNDIASGSQEKLSQNEKATLSKYAKLVGYNSQMPDPNTTRGAYALVSSLTGNTYRTAIKSLSNLSKMDAKEAATYIKHFEGTITHMRNDIQQQGEINKSYQNIAKTIFNSKTGQLKEGYEGAKIIGKLPDGTPIFDVSKLSEAKKQFLNNVVGKEFTTKTNTVGSTYSFSKPSDSELYTLFQTSNTIKVSSSNGEKINANILNNIPDATLKKLFGDKINASFDPGSENMIVKVKLDPTDALGKKLGIKSGDYLKVKIPYALINSNPSLTRFKRYADNNSLNPDSYGLLSTFAKKKFSKVEAPQYMEATGFDFTATGANNPEGKYGINLTTRSLNPTTKKWTSITEFHKIDSSNPNSYHEITETINALFTRYQMIHSNWQSQF
jgi:hypothetical protein